jgi:hypothetical protein
MNSTFDPKKETLNIDCERSQQQNFAYFVFAFRWKKYWIQFAI